MRGTITIDDDRGQAEAGKLIGLTIALVIGVTMISVIIPVVADNSGTVSVTNETVTQSATLGQTYDLDGFDIVSGSETVYFENGTAGSFETATGGGTDYTLHEANGSITLESTGEIDAGDEVKVSYDYEATSSTTATILDLLALFLALILLVALSGPIQRRL